MNPFVSKLRYGARLSKDDEAILAKLIQPARQVQRGDFLLEGAAPRSIILILEGWACRYKNLKTGKRQITTVFVPGDMCQPFGAVPPLMDYTFGALVPVVLVQIPLRSIREAAAASPRIEEALWWDLLLYNAIGREHMVNLGRRSGTERLGYFFCELLARLGMVGLADNSSYAFPVTQADLADLLGLSTVHVNRSLQELKEGGLLSLRNRRVTIHDVRALRELSMFDPSCLLSSMLPRS